ncbi:MAG TPA: SURF1 family protein, partial [Steroidobacteraceae bacterium]|nr:SURF1 family protein [Steroidobacteraceae bacterium]
ATAIISRTGSWAVSGQPHSRVALVLMALGAVLLCGVFVKLGTWQVERRAWKLALIARVEQRVHAPPVAAPPPARWPRLTAANSEYLRVRATGTFLNEAETLVQATTELGAGFWVMTPLQLADGSIVLVNRGFVPPERRDPAAHGVREAEPAASVTGLLRMSEPGGGFLRHNDPAANRWYSRDVQAIARARGLAAGSVAPYFIDAEKPPGNGDEGSPVPGLTVIAFHNSHLVYAITWYTLALMVIGAGWIVMREELRRG